MVFPMNPPNGRGTKIDVVYLDRNYPRGLGVHTGWDINGVGGGNTDLGMAIFSIADGVVVEATDEGSGTWGGLIVIHHPHLGVWSRYGHHQKGTRRVKVGDQVAAGNLIAGVGRGYKNMFLAHLHFDIFRKQTPTHWGYWPNRNLEAAREFFLDPTILFGAYGVVTPKPANERRLALSLPWKAPTKKKRK